MQDKITTFVYTLFHAKFPKKIAKQRKENIMTENEIFYKIIIEVKSIESLAPVHFAQTLTYLRLS